MFNRVNDGPGATGGAEDSISKTADRADSSSNSNIVQQQTNKEVIAVVASQQQSDDKAAVWSTPELVDAILEENFSLRQQVTSYKDNIAKLQKVRLFIFTYCLFSLVLTKLAIDFLKFEFKV